MMTARINDQEEPTTFDVICANFRNSSFIL
jgi:hypothetical protein